MKRNILLVALVVCLVAQSECVIHGRFVQMGDFHYDPTYESDGDSCNMFIAKGERKLYGNYHCDSPRRLVESAVKEANMLSNDKTDFVMWSGDVALHVREEDMLNVTLLLEVLNTSSVLVRDGIHPDTPVYPMIGNHDYFPKSQLPTTGGLYEPIAEIFCPTFNLEEEACKDFTKAGYYSQLIEGRLLLLVTNTNLYAGNNQAIDEQDPDPAGQFAWMREKLKTARQQNQRVHVFAHIPPGMMEVSKNVMMFKESYNKLFNDVIREYADVIIGVYSAHTHTDSFRIYYNEKNEPVVPLLISPAVTPWRWDGGDKSNPPRNPALRVITHKPAGKMELTDYEQYYLNLERANDNNNNHIRWDKEYSFTSYEGAENASAKSLHAVAEKFKSFASTGFHNYFERNSVLISRNGDKPPGLRYTCDRSCKDTHICTMMNIDLAEYKKCFDEISSGSSYTTASLCSLAVVLFVSFSTMIYY